MLENGCFTWFVVSQLWKKDFFIYSPIVYYYK